MHVFPRGLRGDDTEVVVSYVTAMDRGLVSEGLGSLVGAIGSRSHAIYMQSMERPNH